MQFDGSQTSDDQTSSRDLGGGDEERHNAAVMVGVGVGVGVTRSASIVLALGGLVAPGQCDPDCCSRASESVDP